jgi:hypothetical protein
MATETRGPETTDRVEVLLAVLLGIAAVATAFAAFKASLIGDEVISNYNQGIRKVDEASQLYNEGNQYLAQDQAVFLEYVKANQVGDTDLADYIRETLMSEELYNGIGWWEETPDATTPFVPENPDYYLPQFDQAIALDEEVDEHFTLAADADEESDRFEFATVLLAAVLFFLGMASVVRSSRQRRTFLVMGAVVLLASLVQLGMLLL